MYLVQILACAFLLVLSFPPFDAGWFAFFALAPWLSALARSSAKQALLGGTLVGFAFFAGTIWWVGHVSVIGALVLIAYMALFFGLWGLLAHRMISRTQNGWSLALTLPAAWVLVEYLRSILFSGFGWNLLAYSQWNWLELIQLADVTGPWGISFLIVMVNVALWQLLSKKAQGRLAFIVSAICLLAVLGYGTLRLEPAPAGPYRVALLQGNIPQPQKWDADFAGTIWERYRLLTERAKALSPDLIIWPETSVPGFLDDEGIRPKLKELAALAQAPMLVGVPTAESEGMGQLFNSAVLIAPDGAEQKRYDKLHLVPFGEFVPLQFLLGWLSNIVPIGDFSPGREFTVFESGPLPYGVLICFEDLFPELSRQFVRSGAGALWVITNDAWFGRSAASVQHLQASVFRAVENHIWVGRSANTGWTGFIDPYGRRLSAPGQVPRFEPAVAFAHLPVEKLGGTTVYTRCGDFFLLLCLALAGLPLIGKTSPL